MYFSDNLYIADMPEDGVVTIEYGITEIIDYALKGLKELTSVTIPDSVTSIGNYAFSGCSGLTSVVIPDSVTSIGEYAFSRCSGLTSVTIPDSVTSIGNRAFYNCSGLTNVYYQGDLSGWLGIEFVSSDANPMYYAKNLNIDGKPLQGDIVIPAGTDKVGDYVFYNCSSLTSIVIPDSVTSIGNYAFYGCSGLTSVTIPGSVTSIGNRAFNWCSGLTDVCYKGDVNSWLKIDMGNDDSDPMYYAYNLYIADMPEDGVVVIEDDITEIRDYALKGLKELKGITIPDSVTSIGSWAFSGCSGLTSVTIPDSVTSIGNGAFYNCSGLTAINFQGTMAQWQAIGKGSNWDNITGEYTVICTDGTISKADA